MRWQLLKETYYAQFTGILGYYYNRFTCFNPQKGFKYSNADLLLVRTLTFKTHKNVYSTLKEREKKAL